MEEFIKYKIKQGDTLESIALQHNVSIEELLRFHNSKAAMTQQFFGNELPLYVTHLLMRKNKEETSIKFKLNNTFKEFKYKINLCQKLVAKDKVFADTNTEIEWKLSFLEISKNKIIVEIETLSYKVKNQPADTSKLIEFSMLFNFPVEKLVLELDGVGRIKEVLNQKEIFERWLGVRNRQLLPYQNDDSMAGIFIAGDTEFSNTLKSIQENLLYVLFFDGVYGKPLLSDTYYEEGINLYSKLFQGSKISLSNEKHVFINNHIKIKNIYNLISNAVISSLKSKYMTEYKDVIQNENFDYIYHIESDSNYSKEGILNDLVAVCVEKPNENLYHEMKYTIQLLN